MCLGEATGLLGSNIDNSSSSSTSVLWSSESQQQLHRQAAFAASRSSRGAQSVRDRAAILPILIVPFHLSFLFCFLSPPYAASFPLSFPSLYMCFFVFLSSCFFHLFGSVAFVLPCLSLYMVATLRFSSMLFVSPLLFLFYSCLLVSVFFFFRRVSKSAFVNGFPVEHFLDFSIPFSLQVHHPLFSIL